MKPLARRAFVSLPRVAFVLGWLAALLRAAAAASADADDAVAWAAFSTAAPPSATEHYGSAGNALQELDLYPAKTRRGQRDGLQPVLVLVHGGGWGGGTRDALAPHARYFSALGWNVANLSYRLTRPDVPLSAAQEDVRSAFAWIRSHASERGWDAQHIVVLGESAGGQLACALGVLPPDARKWRAQSLVLVNPVLDLTTLSWALNQPGLREGGAYTAANATVHPAALASPLFQVSADSPRTLLVHGRDDSVVPFAQAEAYVARARTVGAPVELVALENTNHAFLLQEFGQPPVIRATLARIAQFLGEP